MQLVQERRDQYNSAEMKQNEFTALLDLLKSVLICKSELQATTPNILASERVMRWGPSSYEVQNEGPES